MACCSDIWISVSVKRGSEFISKSQIVKISTSKSFSELFYKVYKGKTEAIIEAKISDGKSVEHNVPLDAPTQLCISFSCNSVTFLLPIEYQEKACYSNAFNVLMTSAKSLRNVQTISLPRNEKEKLFNDVAVLFEKQNIKFQPSSIENLGKLVVQNVTDLLWHITNHHDYFHDRNACVPKIFSEFKNKNCYQKKKIAKPRLSCNELTTLSEQLSERIVHPWFSRFEFQGFRDNLIALLESTKKVIGHMESNKRSSSNIRTLDFPVRSPETHSQLLFKNACLLINKPCYLETEKALLERQQYEPMSLIEYEPGNRLERRQWIDNLSLSFPIALYKMPYGGNVGTINFVWRLPQTENADETQNARAVLSISNDLPKFHTRKMQKDFIEKYQNAVSTSKSVLRYIYQDLTGDTSAASDENQAKVREQVAKFVSEQDDPNLLLDLRKLNGNPKSTKFDLFWDEIQVLFDEYQSAVHERRHGNTTYLPFAISVRELVDQVKRRKPDILTPSVEWVRLQFMPQNPYALTALKHTSRFNIKFQVQRRQMRSEHIDSKYAYVYFSYLKEFAVKFKENSIIAFLDDKANVPVGEPDHAVSTNVRSHNKSVGAENVIIEALDHDWKVAGLVPSVALISHIPDNPKASFLSGNPFVTVKDKVFEPSNPFRHGIELASLLRSNYSTDGVTLDKELLLIYTDGGGDHNITRLSTKVSLICLHLILNVDMTIALRCCPTQSWINPAERIMSILNLALQNCALERSPMEFNLEQKMSKVNSMSNLRILADRNENLKSSFMESMAPVKNLVEERFQAMSLKEAKIKTQRSASKDEVEEFSRAIKIIDETVDVNKLTAADLKNYKGLESFIEKHCHSTLFGFQIKKCKSEECMICSVFQPIRLPEEKFNDVFYLPEPMLNASKDHFKSFDSLYGKETSEKDRPSLKFSLDASHYDKKHKELLVSQKVRCVIVCSECSKPRCIYSASKLSFNENREVQRIKDEGIYVCGQSLFAKEQPFYETIVVKCALSCTISPIESTYYAAKTVTLPDICYYCGTKQGLSNNSNIIELKSQFAKVRPICNTCFHNGKEPVTWGANNSKKSKK